MSHYITTHTTENYTHFLLFVQGNEIGLNYIYRHLYKPVFFYGRDIIQDEFVVNSITQEAFLKVWNFRERMTSMLHIFRFIRLTVRWGCYSYLNHQISRFHHSFARLKFLENSRFASYSPAEETEQQEFSATELERLRLIQDAIPYLPASRKTIMTLYFKYGFSYRQIAKRFGLPYQQISQEVIASIDALKTMIVRAKMQTKLDSRTTPAPIPDYSNYLNEEQAKVLHLRHTLKYDFNKIADELSMPVASIVQQYVLARQLVQKIRKHERGKKYSNT